MAEAPGAKPPGINNTSPQETGFILKGKPYSSSTENKVKVELRTGASSDSVIAKKLEQDAEKNQRKQAEQEAFNRLSPEEKKEKLAKDSRAELARFWGSWLDSTGPYSETLVIEPDGSLNITKRLNDEHNPLITTYGAETSEDLYELMRKITAEHPQLTASFETGEDRRSIKYTVTKAANREQAA